MPNYGEADYWNDRYRDVEGDTSDLSSPFDWLFSYEDVRGIIHTLIPNKDTPAFLIGCGNAPFSIDMYNDGYQQIRNSDYSTVVIEQQKQKFPHITWELVDAMDSGFATNSVDCIVDKSLIDTILCYQNSQDKMKVYMYEMYRVLKPGGRFITWSLHPIHEVIDHFDPMKFNWSVAAYNVKSSRWKKDKENRHKSVSHTMIVCDKRTVGDTLFPPIRKVDAILFTQGALTDDEYASLKQEAKDFNEKFAFDNASTKTLIKALDNALEKRLEGMIDKSGDDVGEHGTGMKKDDDDEEVFDVDDDETTDEGYEILEEY